MKRRFLSLCTAWALCAGCPPAAGAQVVVAAPRQVVRVAVKESDPIARPPSPAVLRWNNGESLTGAIGESNEAELNWITPLFDEPLSLAWTALHRIDQGLPENLTPDPFAFTLRDGSRLYGDLAEVSADSVTLHSDRHGDLTLRRAEVLSVRRIRSRRLVFAGPLGSIGWAPPVANDRRNAAATKTLGDVPMWVTGPGGSLVMPYFDRTAFLRLPLPDRLDMEFRLRAQDRPAFALSLIDDEKGQVRLETWDDQLVLAAGNGFTVIRTLADTERSVALRICMNRQTRNCQVYTPEGQLLTEWKAPEEKRKETAGISLQNKGRDLALDFLRVRRWDGQPPAVTTGEDLPYVETDDGLVTVGSVSAIEAGMVTVSPTTGNGPTATFPLDAVDTVIFAGNAPEVEGSGTTLTFADGTFLYGQIAGIKDGTATLKTRFADAPVATKTRDLKQMFLRAPARAGAPPEPALKMRDKLVIGTVTMHGDLTATGEAIPRWLPVGGTQAVTPARTLPNEMIRAATTEQKLLGETSLFYTRAGDAIPGTLHGMDRKEVEFDSPIVEAKSLPTEDLEIVQFGVSSGGRIHGFDAPEWQVIKGLKADVQQGDKLNLTEGSIAGHASAMQNGEVRFIFDSVGYTCLRLRMFCDGIDPAKGTSFLLCRMGNSVSTGIESEDGQFTGQNRTVLKNGPVAVRLMIDERSVQCYLNDILVEAVSLPAAKRAGSGLIVEPTSMWGNAVEPVALTQFSASSEPGQASFPVVNADAKMQTLTVPRFRKDDPPRQALLAANGDLLRGEIEAITNTQFGFRVGLEELHVPRDRVRAIVALQKPSDQAPPPEVKDPIHKLLDRKIEQRTWFGRTNLATLISVIQQAAPELKFKFPTGEGDQSAAQYRFDGGSIADTLDSICDLFGLHYRIEKGVIVIDANPSATTAGTVRTVYWLKPGTFGGKDTAEALLAAKGIPFVGGSSATWQEDSQCLEVVNTAENQAKLVGVLNQDFGGILGSPTYWLRLTNGGQIGLTVEAFEPNAIRGTHPIYGRCRVPMSEVYAIHNTLPARTPASRIVGGWRLVYAPEPVLPESGGDGSALLGKKAPLFKLKMLNGGDDFDLEKEKGHVVVLDFWATWCGPCIKALPGMIETMSQFPTERVKFVGMNQAEPPEQVKRFLRTRNWKLAVAMDIGQNVATQYGVEGIPHTVIVGPDGKVTWVRTGYDEDGDEQVAAEVRKLLAAAPGTPAAAMPTQPNTAQEVVRK